MKTTKPRPTPIAGLLTAPLPGAPPGEQRSGPQAITPGSRPNAEVTTYATIATTNITEVVLDGLKVASGPAYPPSARRRRWVVIVAHCPHCRGYHLHFGSSEDPPRGVRVAGCRGRYILVPRESKQVGP